MITSVFVSGSEDDVVTVFRMDPTTGALERRSEMAVPVRPAPLATDPQRRWLFVGRRGDNAISSFRIDPGSGRLTKLGSIDLPSDPCFLATDRSGRFLFSAYYQAGCAAVHLIEEDGTVHREPVQWLATGRGAHYLHTDRSNRFAFVTHIADHESPNTIFQFRFDATTGRLEPSRPPHVTPSALDGPRHLCFHATGPWVYCSNEQGCSVTVYALDDASGSLAPMQTVPTLPAGTEIENACSQIQITPGGRFLYAPNRGHDSIAIFTVDPDSGRLTPIGHQPTERVPRAFSLDPEGRFLLVAGLETAKLVSYRIDPGTGRLEPFETHRVGRAPMWVLTTRLG